MTRTFVAIDFELASRAPWTACAVGLVRVEGHRIVRRVTRLIRPPPTVFSFTWLHGITRAQVASAPSFAAVWRELAPWLRDAEFIAAHKASFDRRVLEQCALRFGVSIPRIPFRCTVDLARSTWRLRPARLPDVARHLGIPLRHHDAGSDAEACARIVLAARAARRRDRITARR